MSRIPDKKVLLSWVMGEKLSLSKLDKRLLVLAITTLICILMAAVYQKVKAVSLGESIIHELSEYYQAF